MYVLIGDGHPVARLGLARVVAACKDDVQCLEAGSFSECIDALRSDSQFDLAFVDVTMRDMAWEDGLRQLREISEALPIIATSSGEPRAEIFRMIELGASGFLPKSADEEQLSKAINLVLSGAVYLPRSVISAGEGGDAASRSDGMSGAPISEASMPMLTKRQREVLKLLAEGKRNGEIAEILGTSEFTVRVHVSAILKGLGVANRTQAALKAQDVLRNE